MRCCRCRLSSLLDHRHRVSEDTDGGRWPGCCLFLKLSWVDGVFAWCADCFSRRRGFYAGGHNPVDRGDHHQHYASADKVLRQWVDSAHCSLLVIVTLSCSRPAPLISSARLNSASTR